MALTAVKQGLGPGSPGYDNLDPTLRAIADRIVAESGGRVWIGSGWRSTQQQASMYDAWRRGTYDVPRVAPPGRSQHNHGRAIDFSGDLRLAQQLGRQYGLIFPMSDEPWHGQLGEGVRYSDEPDFSQLGIQYNLNYTGGKAATPQDIIANRLNAIMGIIGGNEFGSGAMDSNPLDTMVQDPLGLGSPSSKMGGSPELSSQPYMTANVTGGPKNTKVGFTATGDKSQLGSYAKSLFSQFGFEEADYPALVELWNKESGDPKAGPNTVTWNPLAQNPNSTAFGIAQFLNGTWRSTGITKTTNPFQQIMAGLMYIKSQFGNPRNALAFHRRHNWY